MSMDVVKTVRCSKCGQSLGDLTLDEFNAVFDDVYGSRLCFDCEPLGAMSRPEIFWNMLEGDEFTIGDTVLVRGEFLLVESSRTHERTHERTCARGLSSYTYLNRITKNWGVLEELVEYVVCPGCRGHSFYVGIYGGESCGLCGDHGSIPVLAEWVRFLLNGVRENV